MTDLRKAAERALDALEDIFGKEKKDVGAINALRQALTHPERKWVGLSDEEIESELTKEFGQWWGRHVFVCRAIEAKLKEKNG